MFGSDLEFEIVFYIGFLSSHNLKQPPLKGFEFKCEDRNVQYFSLNQRRIS